MKETYLFMGCVCSTALLQGHLSNMIVMYNNHLLFKKKEIQYIS